MNLARDERFMELAMKLVVRECSAEEKAELKQILAEEPERKAHLTKLCASAVIVRELLPLANALEATEGEMTAGEMEAFKAALVRRREEKRQKSAAPSVAVPATVQQRVLAADQMENLVLKVLSERPMDGFDLALSLRKANVARQEGGEGAIYGLLARLENSGRIQGRWRPNGGRMAKVYQVTEKGTAVLQGSRGMSGNLEELSRAILAVDGTTT